jgi:hypothetical protein
VALFHATAVKGFTFRDFPSQKSRTSLEATLLPCGYPPVCDAAVSQTLSPPVSSTSTLSRGCLIPLPTMDSLFTCPKARFPVALGLSDEDRYLPLASPASKL